MLIRSSQKKLEISFLVGLATGNFWGDQGIEALDASCSHETEV